MRAARPTAPGTAAPTAGLFGRADRIAYALFVAVPIIGYAAAALAGHPVIPGDNLVQNEPLRVLAGEIIASGRLPAWNPLLWSGTPLLAGWNAGAMFPATFLFAFLPAIPAWVLNCAFVPAVAASGFFFFLRHLGLRPGPSALGALLFTYTGFMSGQVVHIGLVQGTALTPWVLVGADGLALAENTRRRAGYAALLGVAAALVVLAGDPRAVSNTAVIALVYVASLAVRLGRRFGTLLVPFLAATVVAALISAIQWAPGIGFLHVSQRASAAYGFFSAGSLAPRTLVTNLLAPFLIGGNGNFGLPTYSGSYNLPEVTIGTGLFALAAAGAYLPELFVRAKAALRRGGERGGGEPGRPLVVFFVLLVLGVILTLGSQTPLGHLLVHVPLYGGERLQNRNAAVFDFALAVLAAFLVEDLVPAARDADGAAQPPSPLRRRSARALAALPSLGAVAVVADAFVRPASLFRSLGVDGSHPQLAPALAPYYVTTIVLGVALGAFVLGSARVAPRRRGAIAVALVVADVAMFAANAGYGSVPSSVLSTGPLANALKASIGETGRFAIFNPAYVGAGTDPYSVSRLGVTDLNILAANASVQGYGSIVNGDYQTATATHLFQDLDVSALDTPTFDNLDLRTLVTMPIYLDEALPPGLPVPVALRPGYALKGPGIPAAAPDAAGPWPLGPGLPAYFLLPGISSIDNVTAIFQAQGAPSRVAVTAQAPGAEPVTATAPVRHDEATLAFPRGTRAARFLTADLGTTAAKITAFLVTTSGPRQRYLLDGALQGSLAPPRWSYPQNLGPFVVFSNTKTAGLAWLQRPGSPSPAAGARTAGSVSIVSSTPIAPQIMAVDAPAPVLLVRSEDYSPGWTARAVPVGGGPTFVLPVRRFGLIQAVELPAGRYLVTWRYAPTAMLIGLMGSAIGLVAFLLLVWRSIRPDGPSPKRVRSTATN